MSGGGGVGYEHLRHERLAGTGVYPPREILKNLFTLFKKEISEGAGCLTICRNLPE